MGAAPLRRRDDPASRLAALLRAVSRVRKRPRCSRPPLMPDSRRAPNLNRESDVLEVGRVGKRKQRKKLIREKVKNIFLVIFRNSYCN